ncbi:unnamed protein product [Prunus armeniaca]|uniref:Uncharacterized protein n=1 Tax=Prunus armeniaca TaxID=36596 RepID=A0A6J5UEQ3_PRUAR|nr:unnamed protein product [Prunus armeniaca]
MDTYIITSRVGVDLPLRCMQSRPQLGSQLFVLLKAIKEVAHELEVSIYARKNTNAMDRSSPPLELLTHDSKPSIQ